MSARLAGLAPGLQRLRLRSFRIQTEEKLGDIDREGVCHPLDQVDAGIDRLALHATDIGSINLGKTGEILLLQSQTLIALPGVQNTRTFFVMREVKENARLTF